MALRSHGPRPVVIGAGPGGLTAALRLAERGHPPVVLEADAVVGGISRTVERDGWRFDIGGHRFFTKVEEVEALWFDLLGPEDLLRRPRMSRIFYDGKFFDYPLSASNALRNLGPVESIRCVASYLASRLRRPEAESSFEAWVSARFGARLYRMFFKTYTEKVWGVPADQIAADWAAQRIKGLSLGVAIRDALGIGRRDAATSLIEEFWYPRLGPGMMWEACARRAQALGTRVMLEHPVRSIRHSGGRVDSVVAGADLELPGRDIVSTMPLGALVQALDPPAPAPVQRAAVALRHRDFLTVALVVPEAAAFPDNWIYVHSPEVRLGRVQNFGAWSPAMVKPGRTCLGLEYFVNRDDGLWSLSDEDLIAYAAGELAAIGLVEPGIVEAGYVVRIPNAYPVYDAAYQGNVDVIRRWLADCVPDIHPVGRNGMHRYNNQDHSMLTALLAVENLLDDAGHDVWSVNVDDEYHEQRTTPTGWGGRAAPLTA